MFRSVTRLGILAFAVGAFSLPGIATTVNIDFEGLSDGTFVSNTFLGQGVSFTNAQVLTAGISLNELDFPPHSGQNVVTDAGGPITLTFTEAITSFSAYFTYATALSLTGYDSSNTILDSAASLHSANYVSSGNTPNELIHLSSATGITSVTIAGDLTGGSFVMDDLVFVTSGSGGVITPEPGSVLLLGVGLIAIFAIRRRALPINR